MPRTAGVSFSFAATAASFQPRPSNVAADGPRCGLGRTVTLLDADRAAALLFWLQPSFWCHEPGAYASSGGSGAFGTVTAAEYDFGDLLAATRRDVGAGSASSGVECRAHHVVGVGRAERLGHHVAHAQAFQTRRASDRRR